MLEKLKNINVLDSFTWWIKSEPIRILSFLNHDLENQDGKDMSRETLADFLNWNKEFNPERKFIVK